MDDNLRWKNYQNLLSSKNKGDGCQDKLRKGIKKGIFY